MIYNVRVQPRSSREKIEREKDGTIKVYLNAPPVNGKTNEALREVLADEFSVSKSRVKIIRGQRSKNKVVEIC